MRAWLLAILALGAAASGPAARADDRPNLVLLLMDDMGYGDPRSWNPQSKIPTPALDRLAAEGMRFTDAHSPSSVCTPTRYALLTGRYAWRSALKSGVLWGYSPALIEPGRLTLPQMLRRAGYATAGVGKWHLGLGTRDPVEYAAALEPGPLAAGFDEYFGIPASLDMQPYLFFTDGRADAAPTGHDAGSTVCCTGPFWRAGPIAPGFRHADVLPRFADRAVQYIERRAAQAQPFFLYVAFASPHTPWLPSPEFRGRSGAGDYGDFMAQTDAAIGRVLEALDRGGLARRTMVIATSDNGAHWRAEEIRRYGHRSNGPWRGMKADIFEGGHRVPFVVRWPGRAARGTATDALATLADVMATAAAAAGVRLPDDAAEDSHDLTPVLQGRSPDARRAAVHHSQNGTFAVRQGPWKLIEGLGSGGFTEPRVVTPAEGEPPGQLYDLARDPAETTNVYARHPDVVARLRALLQEYRTSGRSRRRLSAACCLSSPPGARRSRASAPN